MISTGDLRRGIAIEMDGQLFHVLEFQHLKIGRGSAQVRMRLRNIRTGAIIDRSVQAGEKWPRVQLDHRPVQFLYEEAGNYFFMDQETFDQIVMNKDKLGDAVNYLKDSMEIEIQMYGEEPIGVDLPITVELQITKTDPGIRGDTATGGTKPATLETGLTVNVPLFVNQGERIKVDTRTGEYLERVS